MPLRPKAASICARHVGIGAGFAATRAGRGWPPSWRRMKAVRLNPAVVARPPARAARTARRAARRWQPCGARDRQPGVARSAGLSCSRYGGPASAVAAAPAATGRANRIIAGTSPPRVSNPSSSGAPVMDRGAGRAPCSWCRARKPARGFGARPRMSMQRDMPLPRIQPAHGWSGVEGRNASRRGVGRDRLPECRCNGTRRCRASNPRRVGKVAGTGPGSSSWVQGGAKAPLLGRDATGGRSASLAKRVVSQHTACPRPKSGLFAPLNPCIPS